MELDDVSAGRFANYQKSIPYLMPVHLRVTAPRVSQRRLCRGSSALVQTRRRDTQDDIGLDQDFEVRKFASGEEATCRSGEASFLAKGASSGKGTDAPALDVAGHCTEQAAGNATVTPGVIGWVLPTDPGSRLACGVAL